MLFRVLSDDFESGLFPRKCARLPVRLAQLLECIVQQLARVGVIAGDDRLSVFNDFGKKGHVCCVIHGGSSCLHAIEIDSAERIVLLLRTAVKGPKIACGDF